VHHHVRDLRLVGRHVGPVVVRARAVERCSWHTVGGEVEGCDIQEDEEAAAGGIEGCRGMRRRIPCSRPGLLPGILRVGEEGIDARGSLVPGEGGD
jgi:hypothetical protein